MNRIMGGKENHILLILTWRCQNTCPYCWEVLMGRELGKPPYDDPTERTWSEWIEAFEGLPPSVIDVSGGEPMIFEGFKELIANMPKKHWLAMSTNLQDDEGFNALLEMDPKKFISVTCSYHRFGSLSPPEFVLRVKKLRETGVKAHVNIVNHKTYDFENDELLKAAIHDLESMGITCNISPFENPQNIIKSDERLICNAGLNTFTFAPNGDVYRCLSWLRSDHRKEGLQGNLFDGSFERYGERKLCDLSCEIYHILNKEHAQPNMFSTYVEPLDAVRK